MSRRGQRAVKTSTGNAPSCKGTRRNPRPRFMVYLHQRDASKRTQKEHDAFEVFKDPWAFMGQLFPMSCQGRALSGETCIKKKQKESEQRMPAVSDAATH